ncbi:anthranilate synthase component I family protein [Shouchella lehensis]|uniref:Anthranilate synthase component I family protein n=1 Tax=Shouchella lehensis TaxID=300825 RepID=A0A4Y7WGY8_9BACI|nr:aminobenzoate synthetase [Shouchella lehensis]TES46897.1 anthranilate synthase component I family protein [Shouchella lehensis]
MDGGKNVSDRLTKTMTLPMPESEWFCAFRRLTEKEQHYAVLESGRSGRYSIMGLKPEAIIEGKDRTLTVQTNGTTKTYDGELLESVELVLKSYQVNEPLLEGGPPIQGGALGYISYDYVRQIETLATSAVDDLHLPEVYFMVFEHVFVYDHVQKALWICVNGNDGKKLDNWLRTYEAIWSQEGVQAAEHDTFSFSEESSPLAGTMSEEEFSKAVDRIQTYISEGDVFQVNLSVRHHKRNDIPPIYIYEALRELNPSPYMSYIHAPERQIVSASPELLVKKRNDELSTRPIAGTRSRGRTEVEDQRLKEELLSNEKEIAEHVMLVDLERNDLGRVSEYGSVEVDELLVVEKYSHVMHLVSNVKSKLAEGYSLYDCIRAVFPGGTITGAPKVRTMEIIEELEPVRRGLYTGAIGWIGFHGDMELNIVIRTMICQGDYAYVQAGAGVVIDSNPIAEYKESLKKAKALWRAYDIAKERAKIKQ